ncbi:MAG TPA: DeoR/GlpR family DNA-binding transcription regulator [Roseiflexaceae bacterium]|jgi:DeoR/GlpR family transcriptional regulator of sugar metabolism|nr:DeoR/GlpR family DNA-binding transcription regulator [Roseiflexaceae bacterium]
MSQNDQGMSPDRRRDQILAYLSARDRTSVGELSQVLGVSEVTVRKDLDVLESQGVLTRVHGGAVVSGRGRLELFFATREQEHLEEKRRIAQAAAALITSGQQIFLDASTTALQVARLIKDREDLVVVTNGLYTALELNFCEGITTVVVGGTMRRRSSSLVGSINFNTLQRLRVDIGLFGARGITADDGLMESDLDEAQLKQQFVSASSLVVGIVDSSKFGTMAFSAFALPHEIGQIVTDVHAPAAMVDAFRECGVTVTQV